MANLEAAGTIDSRLLYIGACLDFLKLLRQENSDEMRKTFSDSWKTGEVQPFHDASDLYEFAQFRDSGAADAGAASYYGEFGISTEGRPEFLTPNLFAYRSFSLKRVCSSGSSGDGLARTLLRVDTFPNNNGTQWDGQIDPTRVRFNIQNAHKVVQKKADISLVNLEYSDSDGKTHSIGDLFDSQWERSVSYATELSSTLSDTLLRVHTRLVEEITRERALYAAGQDSPEALELTLAEQHLQRLEF